MIVKTAYEQFWQYHEFHRSDDQGWLNESETITSAAVTVANKATGTDVSSSMVSDATPYGTPATKVAYWLKGGTAGTNYIITIKIVTSNGQKFEDRVELRVI